MPSRHDGHVGAVVVYKGGEVQVLDTAYASARVRNTGPIRRQTVEAAAVQVSFAAASAALPRKSMNFALNFTLANDSLTPESLDKLEEILAEASNWEAAEIEVIGHTDRVGTPENNDALSLKRAEYVRRILIERGAKPAAVTAVGMGERFPEVPTEDGIPNAANRRVEVILR